MQYQVLCCLAAFTRFAFALDNGLAATPAMGYSSWNDCGSMRNNGPTGYERLHLLYIYNNNTLDPNQSTIVSHTVSLTRVHVLEDVQPFLQDNVIAHAARKPVHRVSGESVQQVSVFLSCPLTLSFPLSSQGGAGTLKYTSTRSPNTSSPAD